MNQRQGGIRRLTPRTHIYSHTLDTHWIEFLFSITKYFFYYRSVLRILNVLNLLNPATGGGRNYRRDYQGVN